MKFLEARTNDGKVLTAGYETYDPKAKQFCQDHLEREVARYNQDLITATKKPYQLAQELSEQRKRRCQVCGQQTLVEQANRMRTYGGIFWTDSKPSHYMRCTNCDNEQEIREVPSHLLEEEAKHKIKSAIKRTKKNLPMSDEDNKETIQ